MSNIVDILKKTITTAKKEVKLMKLSESDYIASDPTKDHSILSSRDIFLFVLPNMLFISMLNVLVSISLIFYISILGIPAILTGIIFSIGFFIYAVMCIVWGALADKWGRKKVLWIAGILMSIAFVGLWMPPTPPATMLYGTVFLPLLIWFIIFSLAFRITSAGFEAAFISLIPDLSTDQKNRTKIVMINTLMTTIGAVVGMMVPFIIMGNATATAQRGEGTLYYPLSQTGQHIYLSIAIFSIVLSAVFLALMALMLTRIEEPSIDSTKKISLTYLSTPFKDTNYRKWLMVYILLWIPFMAFQMLLLNMATFVLHLQGVQFYLFIGGGVVIVFLSAALWQMIAKKRGVKRALHLCLTISTIAFGAHIILLFPVPAIIVIPVEILLIFILLWALTGIMSLPLVIMSHLIVQTQNTKNKAISGLYSGAQSTVARIGSGIMALYVAIFLGVFGIDKAISYGLIFVIGSVLVFLAAVMLKKLTL